VSGQDADPSSPRARPPAAAERRSRVVLGVVSPKGGSGKTTIALNLALSFARQDRSVILVDADINGDVLSAVASRARAAHGAIDVLLGRAGYEAALLKTVLPKLRVMPALGADLPELSALAAPQDKGWQELLRQLSNEAEIVIVDSPAGMFGATRQFLGACTHVLGVLQAELIASRSFAMFERALAHLPRSERPAVAGVVLNMLQSRHGASVRVLSEACEQLPKGWLLDTAIPRSDAFLEATEEGLPLRLLDEQNPPAVSWLFDTLASEISERMGLEAGARKPRQFLV
jgi:cellulose biosynthesis protein BcsQ